MTNGCERDYSWQEDMRRSYALMIHCLRERWEKEQRMGYGALTAFLEIGPTDQDGPEIWARYYADRWSDMSPAQLQAELEPLFVRLKRACEELKRTDRLSVLEDES